MNDKIIAYAYEAQNVDFDLSTQRVWVNATQMAKVCSKKINDYLRLSSTDEFITALVEKLNQLRKRVFDQQVQDGNSRLELADFTRDDVLKVVHGGRQNGTWMDRVLALHFAAWLDAKFAVWVFLTIEEILFGRARLEQEELEVAAAEEARRKVLEAKFGQDPEYRELQRLRGKKGGYVTAVKTKATHQLDIFSEIHIINNAEE